MVWGGVSQHHRTEPVVIAGNLNAVRYREDILLPHVVPFLQAHPDMTLQHDNATSHTARSVQDFLQDRNVSVLPWPAKSPDLNPIDHVWDQLDRRLRARAIPPRNIWELAGALAEELGYHLSAITGKSFAVHEEEMHCSTSCRLLLFLLLLPLFRNTLFNFC